MAATKIEALLFDLGGVLIDIDFARVFARWHAHSALPLAELSARFAFDEPYRQHERGQISGNDYFAHLRNRLELRCDIAQVADGWNAIFIDEISETRALIEVARRSLPCHVFSNTNATHYTVWSERYAWIGQTFERLFVSSEIGLRKPDRPAFEHVGAVLGVPLDAIMFFDDTLENVSGAAQAGLTAVHVQSPDDVRAALQRIGCV